MKYCLYFSLVTEILEMKDSNLDLKAALKLDYYVGALWWCKQQSYSVDQTSAFFTVVDTLIKNVG
jgi:Flagellar C1a complex subunit C1a-32